MPRPSKPGSGRVSSFREPSRRVAPRQLTHQAQKRAHRPCPSAHAAAPASTAPAARTAHAERVAEGACPRSRHHSAGPAIRPTPEAVAKAVITSAPPNGPFARAATISADCRRPHGHATQPRPSAPVRIGPRMACQPPCATGVRPRRSRNAGCRPRQSKYSPRPRATTCTRVHSGRSQAAACPAAPIQATPVAATAPPAA